MFRESGVIAVALVLLAAPAASAGEGLGEGSDSDVITHADSDFSSLGDVTANITAAAEGDVVGGTNGTFAFPSNLTVYGRPHVRVPSDPTDWDSYCFVVSYSTAHVDEVAARQAAANGAFELHQDRGYYEPAQSAYRAELRAWEAAVATIDEENVERAEAGEPLLGYPAEPEPPTFPLEVCEGAPAEVPDFTPAFDAAAAVIRSLDRGVPWIAPGHGITGLEAYLETGRQMSVVEAARTFPNLGSDLSADPLNPTPISGTVGFRAQGTYMVDWGDGTVDGPFDTPGVPYGDTSGPAITHVWVDTGDYTVTVTDSWRVSMEVTFLGETFIFTHEEELEPTQLPFTVDEVRSLRDR